MQSIKNGLMAVMISTTLISGCALSKDSAACREAVLVTLNAWKEGDSITPRRYWDLSEGNYEASVSRRIISFQILTVKSQQEEAVVTVRAIIRGGATGKYPADYLFLLRKMSNGWKIYQIRKGHY